MAATKANVYDMVTTRIIVELEKGIIPWEKPWTGSRAGAYNRVSKKPYSMINQMLLKHTGEYATFKQWQDLGGHVKKGEKSEIVVFWKILEKEETDKETGENEVKKIPMLRYYNVFHISQVEGVKPLEKPFAEVEPITEGDKIIIDYITREHIDFVECASNEAYYSPSSDRVVVPMKKQYKAINEYYSTTFHELTHSTGHQSRLNRLQTGAVAAFGGEEYSKEELVAEIGSASLMNMLGIETTKTFRNSAAYPTIKQVFTEWNDRRFKLNKIAASTHERDGQVFRRHYKEMGKRRIRDVGSDEFADFLEEQIAECNLTAKAFSNLKSVTRGMLKCAKKRKLIDWSPEEMIQDLDTSGSSFRKVIKEPDEVVFNEDELPVYVAYLEEDLDLKNLGILLMFFTGVRVGELVTLKFSDIEDNTIKIRRTETRVRVKAGKYKYLVKEFPKSSAGVRTVILPETYSWIIPRLKACSPLEEYVFTAEDGTRMTTNVIRRRMEKTCKAAKLKPKSPHKARKTYGSILLDNNIDNRMVTELMGHTDIGCTEGYYHKNRRSIQRKSELLNKIPEFKAI